MIEDYTITETHDPYYYEINEFLDCIQKGEDSQINSPERSIMVMRILDQIRSAIV